VHGLRPEYQDRVNFVILDYDRDDDIALAKRLNAARHPAFVVVAPDSDEVVDRKFGPLNEPSLRELLDGVVARFGE
jgi:hypothetical protein